MPRTRQVFLALLSFVVSAMAGAALVLLFLGSSLGELGSTFLPATLLVLVFAVVPFALAIGVLHAIKRTGWLAHTLAGLLVSLAAQFIMSPGLVVRPSAVVDNWPIPLAGAVAGLVYWLVFQALDRRFPRRV
jgi:hypothetical protein